MVRRYRLPGPHGPRSYGISVGSPCAMRMPCDETSDGADPPDGRRPPRPRPRWLVVGGWDATRDTFE
eukprot:scaffold9078_cov140-Isochrysis_galbana.AAC.2